MTRDLQALQLSSHCTDFCGLSHLIGLSYPIRISGRAVHQMQEKRRLLWCNLGPAAFAIF